ncbi:MULTISPECIES: site-specific integrase [Streptomyces]|uniref:Tyrosine-type recombinase/integrase n=1 Tax=Streptomyces griseocarneus TaxID=51201 RepID=A0ABX7RPH9_9ACTN|nr:MULTISPECIES: tyrosine-type recombinase/integrase [Streptomyces]QSY50181.1 tyrosine-type recombinase/integrase [Streptomyces griseocarneus]
MTETPRRSRKAGNGDDSIYWDKSKNRYIGATSLGFTAAGKRSRPKVSGRTKTEVRQKLRELKKELEAGVKPSANYTVRQAVEAWFEQGLKGRDPNTVTTYRSLSNNHIIPDLGKAKLRSLEVEELDDWLDRKAEVLADRSLKILLSILRRSIRRAQRAKKAARNVAELVELPEGRPGRPSKSLTLEQAVSVLRADRGTWIHAYVVLALLVGVRTEEERPLTWRHVHLSGSDSDRRPHVDVWRSVRRHGDTKTRKSRRSLVMPRYVVSVMTDLKRRQMRRNHGEWTDDNLVFPDAAGEQRDSHDVRRCFRALLKEAGFERPAAWTPRELRTSFVSLLSDYGIPIEEIARIVGHNGSATTELVYRKELRPAITAGAEAMDEIFADALDDLLADEDGGERSS